MMNNNGMFWLIVIGLCVLSVILNVIKNKTTTTVQHKFGCGCLGVILIGFFVTGALAATWVLYIGQAMS